jgi:hypothetical protein
MTDTEVFLASLRAFQHQCLAMAQTIEIILEAAGRPGESFKSDIPDVCQHPMAARVPTPVMGHKYRFHCKACNQDVEE